VKLVGDADGIAALKELSQHNRDYLKFLIAEAGTNTDHTASFSGPDGTRWHLVVKPGAAELEVKRAT
jgi:hypothetical protein